MPLRNWTFFYSLPPSATETQITSISLSNNDLVFEYTKERDQVFHRLECKTEFTLYGAGYDTFKALLDANQCDEIMFHARYNNVEKFIGSVKLKKAKWFPDTCNVTFSVNSEDDYNCIFENWENERNMFDFGSEVIAKTFFGTIVTTTCGPVNNASPIEINGYFELNVNACLSGNDAAYVLQRAYIEEITPGSSYDHYATFVSEQATTACVAGLPVEPPGDGWVLLVNNCPTNATWGRPVQVNYVGELSGTSGKYWDNTYEIVGGKNAEYDNARLLSAVLQGLVTPCGLTVKSDFFNINPPGTASSNAAYTASAAISTLFIYQKSDIKRPGVSNPATVGFLKLKDLLSWLNSVFCNTLRWKVSGTDFIIEHISFFEGANGEDLTITQAAAVNKRNNFTFDTDKLAPRETFAWMDPTTDADFHGLDIIYPSSCTDNSLSPVPINADRVFTDLGRVDSLPDSVSDEGFFLMATDLVSGVYYINRETGAASGDVKPNAHMSWANLQENYGTWGRLQATGTLNNVSQTFNSYKRSKRQQPIPIQLSVDDFFALDITEKMKTLLGWGEIEKGTFSAAQCRYTIELLHDD